MGIASDARDGVKAGLSLIRQMPDLAGQTEKMSLEMADMSENGFRLSPETIDQIGKAEARHSRWGHIALWVIAVLSAIRCFSADEKTCCRFSGGFFKRLPGLFQLCGLGRYLGFAAFDFLLEFLHLCLVGH